MKIRLSEDEIYEIKMPEEIGIQDFRSIVEKFDFLLKNFSKFNFGDVENSQGDIVLGNEVMGTHRKQNKERWIRLKTNRDLFVELLKTYYKEDKRDFLAINIREELGFNKLDMCGSQMIALREFYKLEPKEVGLIRFPSRQERVEDLRLGEIQNE